MTIFKKINLSLKVDQISYQHLIFKNDYETIETTERKMLNFFYDAKSKTTFSSNKTSEHDTYLSIQSFNLIQKKNFFT